MNKKNNKYSHINEEQRGIIRDKLYSGASANEIAKELEVSHTTITREVKRNRVEKIPNIRTANPALYCEKFQTCGIQMELCQNRMSPYTHCKKCVYVKCYTHCKNFKIIKCPQWSNCKSVFKDKINREGHIYQDFLNLSQEDKNRVFEMDSVESFKWNKQRILTLHKVNIKFQLLCLVPNENAEFVVWLFNYIEITLGSRELFEKIFGIILADRSKEFNFFLQLEMSILEPGEKNVGFIFAILKDQIKKEVVKKTMNLLDMYFQKDNQISMH